ncbi:MAG: alpha/beta hydrolase, partial [Gemmatimonadota bacterium]
QALSEVGIRVLRFNFRGVGTSTGAWDGGVGEKEDVRAALDWMASEEPDLPLVLAGFSFGSRMGLEVAGRNSRVRALVGLGLPVAHYDFEFLRDLDRPLLVVQGENDEFGGEVEIRALFQKLGPSAELAVIPSSGHYFHDHFDELKSAIRAFFESGGGAEVLRGGHHA